MVSFPDRCRPFGALQAVARKVRWTLPTSRAVPWLLRKALCLSKPVCRPLSRLPRPLIAAVVREAARLVPAQAASVVALPIQAPRLRLVASQDWPLAWLSRSVSFPPPACLPPLTPSLFLHFPR